MSNHLHLQTESDFALKRTKIIGAAFALIALSAIPAAAAAGRLYAARGQIS
jgi:hypothetical protein